MRIVLAYPWDGHAVGDVLDVDDRQGRKLVSFGRARSSEVEPDETTAPAAPKRRGPAAAGRRRTNKSTDAPASTPQENQP